MRTLVAGSLRAIIMWLPAHPGSSTSKAYLRNILSPRPPSPLQTFHLTARKLSWPPPAPPFCCLPLLPRPPPTASTVRSHWLNSATRLVVAFRARWFLEPVNCSLPLARSASVAFPPITEAESVRPKSVRSSNVDCSDDRRLCLRIACAFTTDKFFIQLLLLTSTPLEGRGPPQHCPEKCRSLCA